MPKIFSKDCKITVVEYGVSSQPTISWKEFKAKLQGCPSLIKSALSKKAS